MVLVWSKISLLGCLLTTQILTGWCGFVVQVQVVTPNLCLVELGCDNNLTFYNMCPHIKSHAILNKKRHVTNLLYYTLNSFSSASKLSSQSMGSLSSSLLVSSSLASSLSVVIINFIRELNIANDESLTGQEYLLA